MRKISPYPVFHKLNDQVNPFGNDIFEYLKISTMKHTGSIIMLGVVASSGEKIPPVWYERSYRLTFAVYNKVLETKILPWRKKITKKLDYVLQHDGAHANTAKTVQHWLDAEHELLAQRL